MQDSQRIRADHPPVAELLEALVNECPHGEPVSSGIVCPACEGPRPRARAKRTRSVCDTNPFAVTNRNPEIRYARFGGRCYCATDVIDEGAQIAWDNYRRQWVHLACLTTASQARAQA
jgi:hypothetical protein